LLENGSEENVGRQALSISEFDIQPEASAVEAPPQMIVRPADLPAFPWAKRLIQPPLGMG
jgi:hypothetical protein